MNLNPHPPMATNTDSGARSGEETLRLIARLPAPAGIEERVHKALHAAPPRMGQVVAWPTKIRSRVSLKSGWMRGAAAAAIVFVVVGGGWGVYSRVEQGQAGKVVVMPARIPAAGGFSGAGAMRTPQTLPGPTIGNQATPASTDRSPGISAETQETTEQDAQAAKKLVAPKKSGGQPAASRHSANQAVAR